MRERAIRRPRGSVANRIALAALLSLAGGGAIAEDGGAKRVDLDELLKLPDSIDYAVDQRGGATRSEWQERFQKARADIEEAQTALEKSQAELEEVASTSGAWQVAPPGVGATTTEQPLDFRLRQSIRRQRRKVEEAERRLQDLVIEANLADVPEDWRM